MRLSVFFLLRPLMLLQFADDDRIMDSITAPETPATEGQDVVSCHPPSNHHRIWLTLSQVDDDHGATVTAPDTPATEGQDVVSCRPLSNHHRIWLTLSQVDDDHGATIEQEPSTDQHMDPVSLPRFDCQCVTVLTICIGGW
jgi:hypothetical protein